MSERSRIVIHYGGIEYALADREVDDVVDEIERGLASDEPVWMEVKAGEGRTTPARILLARGVPVAVWSINGDGLPAPREDPAPGPGLEAP
jgi:hypothetical protein